MLLPAFISSKQVHKCVDRQSGKTAGAYGLLKSLWDAYHLDRELILLAVVFKALVSYALAMGTALLTCLSVFFVISIYADPTNRVPIIFLDTVSALALSITMSLWGVGYLYSLWKSEEQLPQNCL